MIKLTHRNYFTKKNTAISNSKVGDYLKSKEYYKAKHIDHTVEFNVTPSMKIGSMVDEALTKGKIGAIKRKYHVKVLKKDDPQAYERNKKVSDDHLVTQLEYDKAVAMSKKVLKSDLYKWYTDNATMMQVILQDKVDGVDVCGVADAVTVVGDTVYLDDWKTSTLSSMESPKKWLWKCQDFGYLRQISHYRNMLSKTWGDKEIVCRHIVISNDSMYPQVKIFQFNNEDLIDAYEEFKRVVHMISTETEWKDPFPDHTKPLMIKMYE